MATKQRPHPNWSVGDRALVPLHGVCTIRSFLEETILGEECRMVELAPETGRTTLKIPLGSLESRGVRRLLGPQELEDLLKQVSEADVDPPTGPPHQRVSAWVARLRSEGPGVRHRILREIAALQKRAGKLLPGERELQDRLGMSLRREMELAMRLSPSNARRRLHRALTAAQPQRPGR